MEIERLLQFALKNKIIEEMDIIPSRNALLDLLKVNEPNLEKAAYEDIKGPQEILNNITDYAFSHGLLSSNTTTARDLFDTRVMGVLMPRQSEVAKNFYDIYNKKGPKQATDEYYKLSKSSKYIRMDRILAGTN